MTGPGDAYDPQHDHAVAGFDAEFDEDVDDEFYDDEFGAFTPEQERLIDEVVEETLAQGPATLDDLVDAISAAGVTVADGDQHELRSLLHDLLLWDDSVCVHDGRVDLVGRLLEGRVFTHRLTVDDVATASVPVEPDLALALSDLSPDQLPAADFVLGDDNAPRLAVEPPSVLSELTPGDLIGVRFTGGALSFEPVPRPGPGTAETAAVLAELQPRLSSGMGTRPAEAALTTLMAGPDLFTEATLPLSELLTNAGLTRDGEEFGPGDQIWGGHHDSLLIAQVASSYDLDGCCLDALLVAYSHWRAHKLGMVDHAEATTAATAARALGHGDTARALAEVLDQDPQREMLRLYASDLLAGTEADATSGARDATNAVGPRLLVANLAEIDGDTEMAERLYRRVLDIDEHHPSAIDALAMLAFDRSDFRTAGRLLRRIYEHDDSQVEATDQLAEHLIEAGRNDPCPCGSGRKYKVCHSGRILTRPDSRTMIVMSKLAGFAISQRRREQLAQLAHRAFIDPEHILTSRLLLDAYLLDHTNVDAFRTQRGRLLPPEEAELLDRLAAAPLRLVELGGFDPDTRTVTSRDVATGEPVPMTADAINPAITPGSVGLVRVLDTELIGNFSPVPDDVQASLRATMEAGPLDAERLVSWYATIRLRKDYGHDDFDDEFEFDDDFEDEFEFEFEHAVDPVDGDDRGAG